MKVKITKRDGNLLVYSHTWPKNLIKIAAGKVLKNISDDELDKIEKNIFKEVLSYNKDILEYEEFRNCVKIGLKDYPDVCNAYLKTHKDEMAHYFDNVCDQMKNIMIDLDKSSGTKDSHLVSSQRALKLDAMERIIYQKFILTDEEQKAFDDGFIYIHDMGDRRDTINCCLFDMENVLKNGFEMGNIWIEEPDTLIEAFDLIASVTINASAQIYGGFTIPQIDNILSYYAKKSYNKYIQKYKNLNITNDICEKLAIEEVKSDMEYGFKSLECKLNTTISPRGDYPFITITLGICCDKFAELAASTAIKTRMNGQGKTNFKRPVLFPKLVFLFDHNLHTNGKPLYYLFEEALACSSKVMYPEFLSLTGEGYVASIYKKYGKVISPMCCRAFLSSWFKEGGMMPKNEVDEPIFVGRFNIGVVSLNLPMILAKSRKDNLDFHNILDVYLEMIRNIHKKTYSFLSKKKASSNPLGFMQGGLYGGHLQPNDTIEPLLKSSTASFGITALNELQQLYNNKSLVEDGKFALETIKYINDKVKCFQKEDNILYTVYGTPAETLCGKQAKQFKDMFGEIKNVSDRSYFSNSFHCHVSEHISQIEKQDYEFRFWDYVNGGKIQYIRFDYPKNVKALESIVMHAMDLGLYEGINLSLSYCNECGKDSYNSNKCPYCGSDNIIKIERMCGFISYTKINGESRLNDAKMDEIKDRISM